MRIGNAGGDRAVVPEARRYRLRLRMDAPRAVTVDGRGELARLAGVDQTRAGWWSDGPGFIAVRLPDQPGLPRTVMLRT